MKRHVAFEYYDLGTEQELKFSGLAYSGAVVEHFLGKEIVDVRTMCVFSKEKNKIPVFRNHDSEKPLGHAFVKLEDGKVLIEEGLLYGEDGEKIFGMMKKGLPMELSIGFEANPDDVRQLNYGEYEMVNNIEVTYPVNIWKKAQLNEISLVAFGADRNSEAKVYRAMKNYKATKGKKEMAKKIKGFYECSCQEQKEQSSKMLSQIVSMMEKHKDDEELYSLLLQLESMVGGFEKLVDSSFDLETQTKEFSKKEEVFVTQSKEFEVIKSEYEQALLRLEDFDAKEAKRIEDEKKVKLSEAFKKIGKEVTTEVEVEFLSMTEKQFSVALEAMQTNGKSYLFNKQETGNPKDAGKEELLLRAEAKKIRQDQGISDVLVSYKMAKKNLGL